MRLHVFLVCAAGLGLGTALAAEQGSTKNARINLDEPTTSSVSDGKSTGTTSKPASSGTATTSSSSAKAGAKKQDKKDEKPRKVDGFEVSRTNGGFLGIKIEDSTFRVKFYDKDKKPVEPDVASIALRWPVQYQPNPERTLLSPTGDGKTMGSEKVVRPPFHFRLFITLLKSDTPGDDPGGENYVVEFAQ